MKEQEAGFLEKAAVTTFLWLEKHLEAKPTPIDQDGRRRLLETATWTCLALLGGTALWVRLTKPNPQTGEATSQPSNDYYNADWQKHPDVHKLLIETRKNGDLAILEAAPFPIRTVRNNLFYQPSKGVILAIDIKALENWLDQFNTNDQIIAFVLEDDGTKPTSVSGAKNFVIKLDDHWQKTTGNNILEQGTNFSSYLSGIVALTNEYISQYGIAETEHIFTGGEESPEWQAAQKRLAWYQERFIRGEMPFFIRVLAVNPLWSKQKQVQNPRP